jgi:hypothetical protein
VETSAAAMKSAAPSVKSATAPSVTSATATSVAATATSVAATATSVAAAATAAAGQRWSGTEDQRQENSSQSDNSPHDIFSRQKAYAFVEHRSFRSCSYCGVRVPPLSRRLIAAACLFRDVIGRATSNSVYCDKSQYGAGTLTLAFI